MKRKLVFGAGINNASYITQSRNGNNRIACIFYRTWHSMLRRCYSKLYQRKQPTYYGCKVCGEWLTFSNFKVWMETQDWQDKQLDKDILGDGKLYSPETCCFVESWLNKLFTDRARFRGEFPIGVTCLPSGNYSARVSLGNKTEHIGVYSTLEDAHHAYLKSKAKYVRDKMKDFPDQKIREAVLKRFM